LKRKTKGGCAPVLIETTKKRRGRKKDWNTGRTQVEKVRSRQTVLG